MLGIQPVDKLVQNIHESMYLRPCLNLTTINPSETAGFKKIFHIFEDSMRNLQMFSLVLENTIFFHTLLLFS